MGEQTLQEQLEAQQAAIEHLGEVVGTQAVVIERQERRLVRLEGTASATNRVLDRNDDDGRADRDGGGRRANDAMVLPLDETTDRRHLLSRAATMAAGAVVGGTALALGQASPAAAAQGSFTGNPAVLGQASPTSGTGVSGNSTSGNGVIGASLSNVGVYGSSDTNDGVVGDSNSGYGVLGVATTGVGVVADVVSGTHLLFGSSGSITPPPNAVSTRSTGAVVKDTNNDLWLCVAGGTPGTWRKLAGPSTAGSLHMLATPVRVYDSRVGFPPAVGTKAKLVGGVARTCDLKANGSGVPAGATAVLVNLVATGTTGAAGGFLAIYRNGIAWPGTSSLNWSASGQNVAVTTVTAVDANAVGNLYANLATDVVVDVIGYYR